MAYQRIGAHIQGTVRAIVGDTVHVESEAVLKDGQTIPVVRDYKCKDRPADLKVGDRVWLQACIGALDLNVQVAGIQHDLVDQAEAREPASVYGV